MKQKLKNIIIKKCKCVCKLKKYFIKKQIKNSITACLKMLKSFIENSVLDLRYTQKHFVTIDWYHNELQTLLSHCKVIYLYYFEPPVDLTEQYVYNPMRILYTG